MKVLSQPSSGALGNLIAYMSPFGQIHRSRVRPKNTWLAGRDFMRGVFGHHSQVYSRGLTQAQRDRWCYAGSQVMSHPRMGSGPLSGQQFHERVNCVLSRVGRSSVAEPPAPVVFGQAPCSAGRSKRRNVSYLGLLGSVVDGLSEITAIYKARFGEPRPGTKVFIVTCQQKDAWEGPRQVTSEIVPETRIARIGTEGETRISLIATEAKTPISRIGTDGESRPGQQAASEAGNSQKPYMHKGSTRGAKATGPAVDGQSQGVAEAGEGGGEDAGAGDVAPP